MTTTTSNNTRTATLLAATATDTTLIIQPGGYEPFLKNSGDYIYAVLVDSTGLEVVKIDIAASRPHTAKSAGSGTTYGGGLSVERGQGGTFARAWKAGTLIFNNVSQGLLNDIRQSGDCRTVTDNPNGVLSPAYANERVFNTPNRWWQAVGETTTWKLVAGPKPAVWVANYSYPLGVTKINPETGSVITKASLPITDDPYTVLAIGDYVYAAIDGGYGTPGVRRIHASTLDFDDLWPLPGTRVRSLAYDGEFLWALDIIGDNVLKIDLSDGAILDTVAIGSGANAIACGGGYLCATTDNTASVLVIATGAVTSVGIPSRTGGVAYADGSFWVAAAGAVVVDPETASIIATIPVGNTPYGVAYDGTFVWVVNLNDDTVSKIDAVSLAVVDTIPVGQRPGFVAAGDGQVWVVNGTDITVSRINVNTGIVEAIPIEGGGVGIDYL